MSSTDYLAALCSEMCQHTSNWTYTFCTLVTPGCSPFSTDLANHLCDPAFMYQSFRAFLLPYQVNGAEQQLPVSLDSASVVVKSLLHFQTNFHWYCLVFWPIWALFLLHRVNRKGGKPFTQFWDKGSQLHSFWDTGVQNNCTLRPFISKLCNYNVQILPFYSMCSHIYVVKYQG